MKKNVWVSALMALGSAGVASAAPVTVSQTLSLGELLSGGSSSSLVFDLSSTLSGMGLSSDQVVSGNLVVYGVSDAQYGSPVAGAWSPYTVIGTYAYLAYSYAGGGYYVCTSYSFWSGNCSGGYYVPVYYVPVYAFGTSYGQERDLHFTDSVIDRMDVLAGNTTASESVGAQPTAYSGYSSYTQTGGFINSGAMYFSRERNAYSGFSGSLMTGLDLDIMALADLRTDGTLAATVSAGIGQFRLGDAILTVTLDDVSTPSSTVSSPGSLPLALAGLGLAGLSMRRKRERGSE
jgi:hypothetical protein